MTAKEKICDHGHLSAHCEQCKLEMEVARLKAENMELDRRLGRCTCDAVCLACREITQEACDKCKKGTK